MNIDADSLGVGIAIGWISLPVLLGLGALLGWIMSAVLDFFD